MFGILTFGETFGFWVPYMAAQWYDDATYEGYVWMMHSLEPDCWEI